MFRYTVILLLAFLSIVSSASAQTCVGNPVAVQILGSGGPAINPERASAGYLLWVGAQAKLLFDIAAAATSASGKLGRSLPISQWSASAICIPITPPTSLP